MNTRRLLVRARAGAVIAMVAVGAIGVSPAAADPGERTIVAGTGTPGYSGDFGNPTAAQLRKAAALAVLPNGSFVIADEDDHRVRVVSQPPTGSPVIRTLAGTGTQGYSGDFDLSNAAQLSRPRGIAVDSTGAVYISDSGNNRVRKIAADGIITTVAGNGNLGYTGDGGPATSATLSAIDGLAVDTAGNIYIADGGNHVVRKVTKSTGVISTIAGTGVIGYTDTNLPAIHARLARPADVDVDDAGNVYIADEFAKRVVRIDPAGILKTLAGNGTYGTIAWSNALETGLAYPSSVETDPSGDQVLIGTEEGAWAVSGLGRIARASYWGDDIPNIPNKDAVLAIALRQSGDVLIGVGASVQRVERPVGYISGIVQTGVEGEWLPVAGARVQLLDPAGQPVSEVVSDSLGRYKVAAPVGQWNIRFTKPGFRTFDFLGSAGPYNSGVRVPMGGSITMANPFLDYLNGSGSALYGQVTAPTGVHPSSTVQLFLGGSTTPIVPIADNAGRFLFAGLAPGTYSLKVTPVSPWDRGYWTPAGGFSPTPVTFTVGADDIDADVRVPRDQIHITGTVDDNFGNMLMSGTIDAVDPVTLQISGSAAIAEDGTYHIVYSAPAPAQVALRFTPAWNDGDHLLAWLGGTDQMTPAAIVTLGVDDVVADFHLPTPPYVDGP